MISVIIISMPMKMLFKLLEFIDMRLSELPFFCIRDVQKIMKQVFKALIDLISNIDDVLLHHFYPLELTLLNLINA